MQTNAVVVPGRANLRASAWFGRKNEEVDHGERRAAGEEGDATPQGRESCFGSAPLR